MLGFQAWFCFSASYYYFNPKNIPVLLTLYTSYLGIRKYCTSKSLLEGNVFSGIVLRWLMFFYPSGEYIQPPGDFGLKSLATPALTFPGQQPFSCTSCWRGLVREQMETIFKLSAMLLPELWARIKSWIWAAFWLWRWYRQGAAQLVSQSQKAIAG